MVFASGYAANIGALPALAEAGDVLFCDALIHASLIDGARLSRARVERFAHNDLADLRLRLGSVPARRRLIVVDGVYSMDGDLAPLPELLELAEHHDAWLYVDDAHAFGVLG
ncbi:MAG TPA: aminotransferase class I/II-fold pyridoxal phosphate-dependent enzyme, partial [Rhodocyclaceae bacterium]|nr:aminotransferase class I/II-fold pyridoxal phosphate-dependent enzyme [Rhodocyclaceae bacterium]